MHRQHCSVINHRRWIFPCDESDNKMNEVTQEVQTQQTLAEKVQQHAILNIEGLHGIRPSVTFDVRSNSPFVSQTNTRQSGGRI